MNIKLVDIWYPGPTECHFRVPNDEGQVHVGIAVQDKMIDLTDGKLYEIQDILYEAIDAGVNSDDAIIEWCEWMPLKDILE